MKRETLDLAQEYLEEINALDYLIADLELLSKTDKTIELQNRFEEDFPVVCIETIAQSRPFGVSKVVTEEANNFISSLIPKLKELRQEYLVKFETL